MPNKFIFADEAGCFTFNRDPNVSKYFILCTVVMNDCAIGAELLNLRRRLAWDGADLGDYFHATTDKQAVRDEVYKVITQYRFSIQATIMEKCKAQPQLRTSKDRFYQYAYFYHFKFGANGRLNKTSEVLITTASLGTKREREAFEGAVSDVMWQTKKVKDWRADFMPCHSDPCLQVVDYCAWAIQRKWESKDKKELVDRL
jgi:Protein of unknown function (DUF3800)